MKYAQVVEKNAEGKEIFTLDKWEILNRFLILGSEENTYYASAKELSKLNMQNVLFCIEQDGIRVLKKTIEISIEARAPKNDPAILVLAACIAKGDKETREYAYKVMYDICRIPTHLFLLMECLKAFKKGWSSGLRKAVAKYYSPSNQHLKEHVVKYRKRNNWRHKDLICLSHPKPNLVTNWVMDQPVIDAYLNDFESLQKTTDPYIAVHLIVKHNFPWECVPTTLLSNPDVLLMLLKNMPYIATLRYLNRFQSAGLLEPLSIGSKIICERLLNSDVKVHPIQILNTIKMFHGENINIKDALEKAYIRAFKYLVPTGKNILIAIDVSPSMESKFGKSPLSPRDIAACIAMTYARTEPNSYLVAFAEDLVELPITKSSSLEEVIKCMDDQDWSMTDISAPILWANKKNMPVDAFVVITDNEYNCGIMPSKALMQYYPNAKFVVLGCTATNYSIADPNSNNMLDIAGFDSAVPQLITEFIK